MKKILLNVAALLCLHATTAQDLTIRYDFVNDKFTYLKGKREVSNPKVRLGEEVRVEVSNLNPFVFIAKCNWTETNVPNTSSISGLAGLLPGVGMPGGLSSLMGALNLEDITKERGGESMFASNMAAKIALDDAVDQYNKLYKLEQSFRTMEYARGKLAQLKFNPYLPSDTLKRIAASLVANSMQVQDNTKNYSASFFMNQSTSMINSVNSSYESLNISGRNFLAMYKHFKMNHSDFAEEGMDETVSNLLEMASKMKETYTPDEINSRIEGLEQQYESIYYTPYSYTCNYKANSDQLTLELSFFETSPYSRTNDVIVPGQQGIDTLKKVRTKTTHIQVTGDMKIVPSVGLGFPTYFEKNQEYANKDSIITATAGNNFSPTIATFLNFYPYKGKTAHWGGSFGVGIPIGGEGVSALNFLMGASVILGNTNKIAISGGLAIGQLTVLAKGYKTGDKLEASDSVVPTRKSFVPGAFFGISFALGGK